MQKKLLLLSSVVFIWIACNGIHLPPNPNPSPSPCDCPTPEPSPTPTPSVCLPDVPWCHEVNQTCSFPDNPCKHNPSQDPNHCELAAPCPEMPPTPEPTPTPPNPNPGQCTIPLNGTPQAGAYWYDPWHVDVCGANTCTADFTPKIINGARCDLPEVGYPGRASCPVCSEDCTQRGVCECNLIAGTGEPCQPNWELQVDSGDLSWVYVDNWKAKVRGEGKGRIRACFPNGNACSKWLEIAK